MSLQFLADASSVVLVGQGSRRGHFVSLGVGATMVALNIAHQAVRQGRTALFTTAGQMLGELAALDSDSALRRRLQHYAAPDLLLIDEVGYLSYFNRHADMLFELMSRRYLLKSTLVTTNRRFADWGEVFPNAACVVSLVDRLMHRAEVIRIEGDSPTAPKKPMTLKHGVRPSESPRPQPRAHASRLHERRQKDAASTKPSLNASPAASLDA